MNELLKSKKLKIAAGAVGAFILALFIFGAGVSVGIHKARFSNDFGRNYEKNFMGPMPGGPMGGPIGFFHDMEGKDFRHGHGIAGKIVSISDNTIVIKDPNNKEISISVDEKTIIKKNRDDIKISELQQDEKIIVLGKPGENGIINANLIRVLNDDGPDSPKVQENNNFFENNDFSNNPQN